MHRFFIVAFFFSLFLSCGAPPAHAAPGNTVTLPATNISTSTATLNGSHANSPTTRGFAWGTLSTLSGGDTATTSEVGSFTPGSFSASLTGLDPSTVYYVRAYATLSGVTTFGGTIYFRTRGALFSPPNNLGLIGYWPMNEGTSTQAGDSSTNKFNGLFPGGAANPTWSSGARGGGLDFETDSSQYVSVPGGTTGLDLTSGTFTISAWIKPESFVDEARIIDHNGGNGNGWTLQLDLGGSNAIAMQLNNTAFLDSNDNVLTIGAWNHVAVTETGGTVTLYVNGVARGTHLGQGNPLSSGTGTFIGTRSSLANRYFDGVIDDVRVYNRALGPTEIATLAGVTGGSAGAVQANRPSKELTKGTTLGPENGLVGLWTFDGPDFVTSVADGSGNGSNGYVYNTATSSAKVKGKLGQALNLSASSDYVNINDGSSLNFTGAISVALWLKSASFSSNFQIVDRTNAAYQGWELFFETGGCGSPNSINWRGADGCSQISASAPTTNEWHHIVATQTGTSAILYVDGTQASSGSITAIGNTGGPILLGESDDYGPINFNGALDDVRIYNRVLTPTEVLQLYKLGATKITP